MKEKIFIVDDGEEARAVVKYTLNDIYDVVALGSGKEMWENLKRERPDLILLDIMMPDEDGLQIAAKLTSSDKYKDIPIVFVSAKDSGQDVEMGFGVGGVDYIKKPFNPIELKTRVKSILEKKRLEIELYRKSITDPLTNIYNRRYFYDIVHKQVEYVKRSGKPLTVSMIDIDYFKDINDSYGHPAGDYILKSFAHILLTHTRPYDVAARYGGEEFVIMTLDCDKYQTESILNRIRNLVVSSIFTFEESQIRFKFSCGVADSKDIQVGDITLEALLKLADRRLLIAKKSGRNKIILKD